jgi:hypothetical protein
MSARARSEPERRDVRLPPALSMLVIILLSALCWAGLAAIFGSLALDFAL